MLLSTVAFHNEYIILVRKNKLLIFPYPNWGAKELLELCDMARNVQSLRLNERILLLDFVLGPGTSAYKLVKPMVGRSARSSLHNQDTHYIRDRQSQYRSTKYHVARLAKLKLIEKMMDQDSAHRAKPYQPTEY